jgi:hypothetical protein
MAILIGWVLFRSIDLNYALNFYQTMLGLDGNGFFDGNFIITASQNLLLFFIGIIFCTPIPEKIYKKLLELKDKSWLTNMLFEIGNLLVFSFILILSISFIIANTFNPFIYFRF